MKHTNLLPLLHPLPFPHSNLARSNLLHTHSQKPHDSNPLITCPHKNDSARIHMRNIRRRSNRSLGIEPFLPALSIIRPRDLSFHDRAGNRRMPAVIIQRAEIRLIDTPTHELSREGVSREHVL